MKKKTLFPSCSVLPSWSVFRLRLWSVLSLTTVRRMMTAFVILLAKTAMAQQDPIYAQYLNNPLVVNPAYTAANDRFNTGIQYRTQWAGVDGNSVSMNFYSNIAVADNKVGAGIMVLQDKIGDTKTTTFNTQYAYKIKFKDGTFSFGLQAGFVRYSNDPSNLNVRDPNDPNFTFFNDSQFNTGVGLLFKNDRYMIGFSVPRLLPSTVDQGGQPIKLYDRNYYLMGAYQVFLTERVRLKPSVLLRSSSGSPLSVDLNMSLNLEDLYTVGVFTRNFNTYGILFQMLVKHYRFGYVFEVLARHLPFGTHRTSLRLMFRSRY